MYWSSVQFSHSVMSISLWPHVTLTTSTGVALQYSYLENSMGQKSPVGSQRVRHSWAAEHIHRLIHNVVLISGVQQSCVCVCVCIYIYRNAVITYGCESWTIKKAEHWRIDGFELECWRRLLTVTWTARRSNQSLLKEISPECSLEIAEVETPILWPPDTKS